MRKFALVILDIEDKVTDRYNLELVTNPSGLGFKLNMATLTGDIEDVITKVTQAKNVIKFTVNQHNFSYFKANSLAAWIQKYSKPEYTMALEYSDGQMVRYCEGRVTNMGKTEMDTFRNLPQDFEFTQTTPFFEKRENTISIQVSAEGKLYPFKYPYKYGRNEVLNTDIENTYLFEAPLVITMYGAISNPTIRLFDENNEVYNVVSFIDENGDADNLLSGEKIVINSAQKKIYKTSNGETFDYRPNVNPETDTFLMAKNGKSTIVINTVDAGDGFKLIGSWRAYLL